ncbi:MAG TPA: hypothetical protein VGM94_04820 [Galbitalea sp.]
MPLPDQDDSPEHEAAPDQLDEAGLLAENRPGEGSGEQNLEQTHERTDP